jgi:hypothetical protein
MISLFARLVAALTTLMVPLLLFTHAEISPVVIAPANPIVLVPTMAAASTMTIASLLRAHMRGQSHTR